MGPYKPLRTWVDFPIPYYMEMSWELIDPSSPKSPSTFKVADLALETLVETNIWICRYICGGSFPKMYSLGGNLK